MKLKYQVRNYENDFSTRHIYGNTCFQNSRSSTTNFIFCIENSNNSDIYEFDLVIFGLLSSGAENDYSSIKADIIVQNHDGTKKIQDLANVLSRTKFIDLQYETVIPLDFHEPFKAVFFKFTMTNGIADNSGYKNKIIKLQKERDFYFFIKMKELENAIAVVGMKHVGSTMVFNMIRIAYKLLEKKINDGSYTEKQEFDVFVTKSHDVSHFDRDDLSICQNCENCENQKIEIKKFVTVVRDIRDSAISSFLRFHFNQSVNEKTNLEKEVVKYGLNLFINSMHENIFLYEKSLEKNPFVFQYEKYKANKVEETTKLFEFLGIKFEKEFVAKVIDLTENYPHDENLPIDLKEYTLTKKNLDYLLTNDHNTSNGQTQKWKTFFTKEQLDIIMEEPLIRSYLSEMDYETFKN